MSHPRDLREVVSANEIGLIPDPSIIFLRKDYNVYGFYSDPHMTGVIRHLIYNPQYKPADITNGALKRIMDLASVEVDYAYIKNTGPHDNNEKYHQTVLILQDGEEIKPVDDPTAVLLSMLSGKPVKFDVTRFPEGQIQEIIEIVEKGSGWAPLPKESYMPITDVSINEDLYQKCDFLTYDVNMTIVIGRSQEGYQTLQTKSTPMVVFGNRKKYGLSLPMSQVTKRLLEEKAGIDEAKPDELFIFDLPTTIDHFLDKSGIEPEELYISTGDNPYNPPPVMTFLSGQEKYTFPVPKEIAHTQAMKLDSIMVR